MAQRRTRKPQDKELYVLAAAYLASKGDNQTQIADKLQINQAEVSRLLKIAIDEKKWLKKVPPIFTPRGAEAKWETAKTKFAQFLSDNALRTKLQALEERPGKRLRSVVVIRNHPDNFHPSVTETIKDVLQRGTVVGMTWGRTMRNLVDLLKETLDEPIRKDNPIQFLPLCGEPLKDRHDPVNFSSSALVAELNVLINGPKSPPPPSLAGVPAIIPPGYKPSEVTLLRRFIGQVAGYSVVFGEEKRGERTPGLVDRVDTILTSLGVAQNAHPHRGIFLQERVDLGDISEAELDEMVVGDVGGIIIPRANLGKAQTQRLEEMGRRWTGLQKDHLRDCARDAVAMNKPGVVVFSRGDSSPEVRGRVVQRSIELGLVNELIVDEELATALGKGEAKIA